MDPVTHIASGALAGRLASRKFGTPVAYALCILAAWLPDIDNFVGLNPKQYLLHHRGITHSLPGIGVEALLLTGLFWLLHKAFTPLKTFITALSLLAVHLWLDVITTYGTQLLAPFSIKRFEWGSVFIIDPIFTLGLLLLFLWSVRSRYYGQRVAALGLALVIAYPIAAHSVRGLVEDETAGRLAEQGVHADAVTVTTDALSPLYWKLMVTDGDRLRVASVSALPALDGPLNFKDFTLADETLLGRLGKDTPFFATWDWFAKWPTMEVSPGPDGGREVRFLDARFYSPNPIVSRYMDREVPFVLTARFDASGQLTGFSYTHHGQPTAYAVTN